MKSKRPGERVFVSIERFLNQRLRLRVNQEKSAVARYHERSFLGFGFTCGNALKVKVSEKSLDRSLVRD